MFKARRFLGAFVAIAVIGISSASLAEERDHSGGFFLRLAAGGEVADTENSGLPLDFSGSGGELDIAIGAVVAENLALHGTVFGWLISDPDVGGGVTGTASGDLDMTAVGGGITYVPSASMAGERDHSGGFFLRLAAGVGVAETKNDGLPLEFSGSGVELDLAIGGMLAENLALHATIFGWLITDDNADLGGITGTADIDMTALGAGVTYYFMPVNIYLSGSVGIGKLSDATGESDNGPAGMVSAGKEWWVSNRWGLGVAGVFGFLSLPEADVSENWSGWNLALMFSATFN